MSVVGYVLKKPKTKPAPKEAKENSKLKQLPKEKEIISWVLKSGKKGKKSELESIINQLKGFQCDAFIEAKTKNDFKESIYQIRLKGNKEYKLSIFNKPTKDADKYPAVSSENPYPFLLSTYKADNLMKKPESLLEGYISPKEDQKK